jgi:hypothetical protein
MWIGVKHQLAIVTDDSDIVGMLCKMLNMLICCMFTASAMVVPLQLLNTVDGFLYTEFWIVECFPRCSVHCVNVVHFPMLMFQTLHYDGLYSFSPTGNSVTRLEFCYWLHIDPQLLPLILFTDEATFTCNGISNTHNSYRWSHNNPHILWKQIFDIITL